MVTDTTTGLIWQKTYEEDKAWQAALSYCENLDYAGYSDWRLPNKNELVSLVNHEKSSGSYSYFPDMPGNYFWSSSTYADSAIYAWRVNFDYTYGGVAKIEKAHDYYYVRCVRNAE